MLQRYQIRAHDEETQCEYCGYPLYRTDYAWDNPDDENLEGNVYCQPECYQEHAEMILADNWALSSNNSR